MSAPDPEYVFEAHLEGMDCGRRPCNTCAPGGGAGVGFHTWAAPTDAMRKRRMQARRAARHATACYRCQMGDPHEVHATAEEVYDLRATEIGPSWDTVRHFLVEPAAYPVTKQGRTLIVENTSDPLAVCPYCHAPTAGPLAGCDKPECTRREIEIEAAFKRLEDE